MTATLVAMRYDSLLVHYLARELHARLAGVPVQAIRLSGSTRTAGLETTAGTLVLELHPARGAITLGAPPPTEHVIPLHRRAAIRAVSAPADERLLLVELTGGPPSRPRWIAVELLTNQWNALVLDGTGEEPPAREGEARGWGGGRILAALWARDAGERRLRPGMRYRPPQPSAREGTARPVERREFLTLLGALPIADRRRMLLERLAWTSPLNAEAILGGADDLENAYRRYEALAVRPAAAPCVLETTPPQPYPVTLPGAASRPADSLLHAIAAATGAAPPTLPSTYEGAPISATPSPELLDRLRRRADALATRARRLSAQASGALQEAQSLRAQGDLLLANLREVGKGAARITLPDFSGGEVTIELDPSLGPSANAARLYEAARRRERAAERVPPLIAAAEAERARILGAAAGASAGSVTVEALEALLPGARAGPPGARAERRPDARYRSSGGLELRVGRSRRDNDALTFHHSSPNDVWLHARDVGGAHVVLRWADATGNPPHRDLVEAAVLAALHSRARTSGTVAVDWTRRKYVRKPRKAPPGMVVPERVKTLFVEPDPLLERRLRGGNGAPA